MNIERNIASMERNTKGIEIYYQNLTAEQSRWKPDAESWSLLEVINHLYDEEREDFRVRMEHVLENRTGTWPSIDPVGWVSTRQYNERDVADSLRLFLEERHRSIRWLRNLSGSNWQASYEAPFGRISAGDLFAAWVAHDLLHLRQIIELYWAWTTDKLQPFSVRYAGDW